MQGCTDCDVYETCNTCKDTYHTYEDKTCHVAECLVENCHTCIDKYLYPVAK